MNVLKKRICVSYEFLTYIYCFINNLIYIIGSKCDELVNENNQLRKKIDEMNKL